jgi:E3 ubiquitin-protein ligase RNF115/126
MSEPAPTPPAAAALEPEPVELIEFFCYECESSVSLPVSFAHPMAQRPPCPLCQGYLLEPGPSNFPELDEVPPPLPATLSVSGSEYSDGPTDFDDDLEELEDIEFMNAAEARLYITHFIQDRLNAIAPPDEVAAATAAAMSLLEQHEPVGEPPAPTASIAALPSVLVSDPAADCAVCLGDLPLASVAMKLPCSHLYHSVCIITWLRRHNSCPLCRFCLPVAEPVEALPSQQDLQTTITIRLTATSRRRVRVNDVEMSAEPRNNGAIAAEPRSHGAMSAAPVSESPTQLAQAVNGEGGGGPANSGETVSSEWPRQPDSDTVMSEAREDDGFFY